MSPQGLVDNPKFCNYPVNMARNRRFSGAVLTARDRNAPVIAFYEDDRVIKQLLIKRWHTV